MVEVEAVEQSAGKRILGGYRKQKKRLKPAVGSVETELDMYLKDVEENTDEQIDCLKYWSEKRTSFPCLYKLCNQVFCVPATSAPIERVFSHGGILMRPHRSSLGVELFSNLLLLKCNRLK